MTTETLDDLILARGLALGVLTKRARLNASTLYKLRGGLVERVQVATISRLAKALGVEPSRVRAACDTSRAVAEK